LVGSACTHGYTKGPVNAPLLEHAKQAQFGGQVGSFGLGATGAYSITDHLVVTGAGQAYGYDKENFIVGGELGLGFYGAYGALRYELIGGFGGQAFDSSYMTQPFSANESSKLIHRAGYSLIPSAQADVGLNYGVVDFGVSARFTWPLLSYTQANEIRNAGQLIPTAVFEPSTFVRVGGDSVRFFAQIGWAEPLTAEPIPSQKLLGPLTVGVGVMGCLDFLDGAANRE
jgi:hypothetical protein